MIETRLLTGSSHYSNFQGTHRRKNRRIILIHGQTATNYSLDRFTFCFICYPFNGFHLKRICVKPQNLFFSFEWSTCFVLHDRLIYHTFSHCQVEFRIFFRFFFNLRHSQDFFRRASCLIALSKCSFKNSSRFFWNFLRRTSCFSASLKTYYSFGLNRNCTLFRFHHSLFSTEYIFFNQHRCRFLHHGT